MSSSNQDTFADIAPTSSPGSQGDGGVGSPEAPPPSYDEATGNVSRQSDTPPVIAATTQPKLQQPPARITAGAAMAHGGCCDGCCASGDDGCLYILCCCCICFAECIAD